MFPEDSCGPLLASGVFDKRDIAIDSANYVRMRSAFCSDQAQTRSKAKELRAGLNIDSKIDALFGDSENDYQSFRSSLCSDTNNYSSSTVKFRDLSRLASIPILDAYNRCIEVLTHRSGISQHVEMVQQDSDHFVWQIDYVPSNLEPNNLVVNISMTEKLSCVSDNGQPVPGKIDVKRGTGVTIICKRDPCQEVMLSASADIPPQPRRISLQRINNIEVHTIPWQTEVTFAMNTAIDFENIPRNAHNCSVSFLTGSWNADSDHNASRVDACPSLEKDSTGRKFTSDFDHNGYGNNTGNCTYRFECDREISTASCSAN
jgi:hypothetical protein